MGEQQGPAVDPTVLASGGGRYLSHGEGLDAQAKALEQLQSLRAAFVGTAEQHWEAIQAALTGAHGQVQQRAQSYLGIGQSMRTMADGVATTDAAAQQGVNSVGDGPVT